MPAVERAVKQDLVGLWALLFGLGLAAIVRVGEAGLAITVISFIPLIPVVVSALRGCLGVLDRSLAAARSVRPRVLDAPRARALAASDLIVKQEWRAASVLPTLPTWDPLDVASPKTTRQLVAALSVIPIVVGVIFGSVLALESTPVLALLGPLAWPAGAVLSTSLLAIPALLAIRATLLNPLRFLGRWAIIADPEQIEIPNWIHGARTFRWHDSVLVIVGVFGWTARVAVVERETGRVAAFNMPRENLDQLLGVVRASEALAARSRPPAETPHSTAVASA